MFDFRDIFSDLFTSMAPVQQRLRTASSSVSLDFAGRALFTSRCEDFLESFVCVEDLADTSRARRTRIRGADHAPTADVDRGAMYGEPEDDDLAAEEQASSLRAFEKHYQSENTWEDLVEDGSGMLRVTTVSA